MRRLIISTLVLGASSLAMPAAKAGDSGATTVMMMAGRAYGGGWQAGVDGRGWNQANAGWQAGQRRGWGTYRRAFSGYILPRYWIQPGFYIGNYTVYGLPRPNAGYGWYRYYDNAVLVDGYGRVYDNRSGIAWGGAGYYGSGDGYYGPETGAVQADYDDSYYGARPEAGRRPNNGGTVAGAIIGGVMGGLVGSEIAGHGNRTAGAVLGAGVGAIAGGALGAASDRGRDRRAPMPDYRGDTRDDYRGYDGPPPAASGGYGPPPLPYEMSSRGDNGVTYGGDYAGRWVGTWYGADGRTYSGEYRGTYSGTVPAPSPAGPPPPAAMPVAPPHHHGSGAGYGGAPHMRYGGPDGTSYSYSYSSPMTGVTTTTIIMQPHVTSYVEEEVVTYAAPRKVYRAKAKVRPKAKPRKRVVRCICS